MRPRRSVLVLGNDRPSLTIVRTLAKKGFHVVLGLGHKQEDGARHSRHVHEIWHHPRIETDDGPFAAALDDLLTYRPDIRILYPVTEAMLRWTATHEGCLPGDVLIASPPAALVDICLDRPRLAECATSEGVSCQPSAAASSLDELRKEAERLGYPVVVRPLDDLPRLGGKTAVVIERPGDLIEMFPAWPQGHRRVLVQRFVRGERRDLYFAADRGQVLRVLEARILRTDSLDGTGRPIEGEIVAVSPRLKDYAGRMARRLNYTGIGRARFLVDPVTDDVSLLAIDPHVADGHECTEAMGMDLTRLAVSLAAGTACHQHYAQFSYEPGWRYSWIYGDLIALKAAIENREIGAAQAIQWLARTAAVFVRADFDLTWDRRDPWPTLRLLATEVPGLLTGLFRRWASVVAWHPPARRKLRAVG
jgi:predicted ATP-grasp superfamily ATP-dependent carboligase